MKVKVKRIGLETKIKVWYKAAAPWDDLADEMRDDVTFADFRKVLNEAKDLGEELTASYELLGVAETIIREACLCQLRKIEKEAGTMKYHYQIQAEFTKDLTMADIERVLESMKHVPDQITPAQFEAILHSRTEEGQNNA